ncbi:MAG: UDP-N-acetylmuramoyl-L-alanyl-D-glutamate--2,6-diaminopimelate ligase [Acidobacteriota bacterium]
MMRLDALIHDLPLSLAPEATAVDVTGICHDSRRIVPGDLYVAIVGENHDGRRYVPEAVARGAVAVLGPSSELPTTVPWLATESPRLLAGPLAARLCGHPDRRMTLIGVTGTNGKSTVTALIAKVAEAAGKATALLGTLGYHFGGRSYLEVGRTTPEAPDLFRILSRMADAGAEVAAMEVSSHALDFGRVAGALYDAAVFTNLSRDHLDYHGDFEQYFAAKAKLFEQLAADGKAVINLGDPWGRRLAASYPDAVTWGEDGHVRVVSSHLTVSGTHARVDTPRGVLDLALPMVGRYHLENALATIALAEALAWPHAAVLAGLAQARPPMGRLEAIDAGQSFPVFVDFAHTPAGLEATLAALHEVLPERKIALVFGCGGGRDRGKREPMGKAAGAGAVLPIATSDNPRGEDPEAILAMVEVGLRASGNRHYRLVSDRREAIRQAVSHARRSPADWVVLVAGTGHETTQEIGDQVLPFSDHDVLRRALEEGHG